MNIQARNSQKPLLVPVEGPMPAATSQLGIKRTSLYQRIALGDLRVVKIGRRTLVTQESIDAFVEHLAAPKADDPDAA